MFSRPIKFMTYNIRRCTGLDGKIDPHRIASVIRSCQPDVVALQEVDRNRKRTKGIDQAALLAELTGTNSYFYPRLTQGSEEYGIAILSKHPFELIKAGALPSGSTAQQEECVAAIWAEIKIGETPLQFIATHFNHDYKERLTQIKTLMGDEWLMHPKCKQPVVFCGDLNTTRRSPIYSEVFSVLKDAQSLFGQYQKTWPSFFPLGRIDHIFVSPEIKIHNISVPSSWEARMASDHLPLVADIS